MSLGTYCFHATYDNKVIIYLDAAGLAATRVVDGQPPNVAGWETIVFPPSHPSLRVGMVTHEGLMFQ